MNILITGGLLGLAVVATIGAILLGLDEKRATQEPKNTVSGHPDTSAQAPRPKRVIPPQKKAETAPTVPVTALLAEPAETPTSKQHEPAANLADLHGQVQEIASEVRSLTQLANELELRLNHLSTLVDGSQHLQAQQPETPSPGQFYVPKTDIPMR